jgi:hypothetical protein
MQLYFSRNQALPDVFAVTDDFGNLRDFGDEMTEQSVLEGDPICPVGAWFFLQGQPLADCYDDDVHQDGFGL